MADTGEFDHYEVLKRDDGSLFELGRGAMGITYKAFDKNLRVPVALKVINAASIDSELARQRFVREARAAAQLRHPNVASVFHLGIEGDTFFYAMEFIEGETLEGLIRRGGPVQPLLALRITVQVARALTAAQRQHLVHRDIKPSNIMLVADEEELTVKVIDFGLAKSCNAAEGEDLATLSTGGFIGTPHFASPEQLEERDLDVRSDIYSLGVTLWYALAGKAPFTGSLAQVMSQHLCKPPPFADLHDVPDSLVSLLHRMLEKDPDKRFQNPTDVRVEAEKCIALLTGHQSVTHTVPTPPGATFSDEFPTVAADAPTVVTEFKTGAVVAENYELLAELGEAPIGRVFRAVDRTSNNEVRLIVLKKEVLENADLCARIQDNVEKLKPIEHPCLLRVFGFERIDHAGFLVLEATTGSSLLDVLRRRRELPPEEALRILQQASVGVDYAIQEDLRQLDLSLPQINLSLLDAGGFTSQLLSTPLNDWPAFEIKLNPLGITPEFSTTETWAGGQTIVGGGSESLKSRSSETDLRVKYIQWLGAVVYELLGGKVPHSRSGGPEPAPRYVPLSTLTEDGNEILKRALDPSRSFPCAQEFFQALQQTIGDRSGQATAKPPVASGLNRPAHVPAVSSQKPFPWGLVGGGLAFLVLLGTGLFFVLRPPNKIPPPASATGPSSVAATSTPAETPANVPAQTPAATASVETQAPTPQPSPPSPTPPPETSREDLLKARLGEATKWEDAQDWPHSIDAYVRIAKDFPESDTGKIRLELLLNSQRSLLEKSSDTEFQTLREPITAAAKLDVVTAQTILAEHLRKTQPEEAFTWFSAAANRGFVPAMTQVGLMYSNGAGVERDFSKAVYWFQQASDQGDAAAKFCLAECRLNGRGTARDEKGAVQLLQEAVAAGDLRAMNLLGRCYHNGIGIPKNFEEAVRLFTKASDLGFLDALGNLGILYMKGEGVNTDLIKARSLFQQGADQGNALCMYLLGGSYDSKEFGKPDIAKAGIWFQRSAAAGNPAAMKWCRDNGISFTPKPAP